MAASLIEFRREPAFDRPPPATAATRSVPVATPPSPAPLLRQRLGNQGTQAVLSARLDLARNVPLPRRAPDRSDPDTAPPIVRDVLRSPGRPLDRATRAFMEPRFGHDFSGVRVHTDTRAAEAAASIGARAFTAGRNIVFGTGEYAPQMQSGQRLLAHELTHVVQQRTAPARAQNNDLLEREAEQEAKNVFSPKAPMRIRSDSARHEIGEHGSPSAAPLVLRAPSGKTASGIGLTKTGKLFEKQQVVEGLICTIINTLTLSGALTVSPENSTVTISDKELSLEIKNLGVSIDFTQGKNNVTFSSKFEGISPRVSQKVSIKPPNTYVYTAENTVVSYSRDGKKVEGTITIELTSEMKLKDPTPVTVPVSEPQSIPWYLLLLGFVEEGGWVVLAL